MSTSIQFNSNNLQTANVTTDDIKHESIPLKNANTYALAHANKSVLPFINYPSRSITITGTIKGSSISDLDSRIDAFKAYFNQKEGNLDIGYRGGTRRYIATVQGLEINRPRGLSYAEFTVVFICTYPFGQDTSATVANNSTGVTAATPTYSATYGGTAPYQQPVITITINSVTGPSGHLKIVNHANGQGITILGVTFAAADVLVLDSKNRTVKLNGVEIDYLGSFIELAPGAQQIDVSDGFTARNMDINISYFALWL